MKEAIKQLKEFKQYINENHDFAIAETAKIDAIIKLLKTN